MALTRAQLILRWPTIMHNPMVCLTLVFLCVPYDECRHLASGEKECHGSYLRCAAIKMKGWVRVSF